MSRAERAQSQGAAPDEARAVAAFLLRLAERVEQDAPFAAQIAELLRESGLLASAAGRSSARPAAHARGDTPSPRGPAQEHGEAPDPFVALREGGEAGLREALAPLELGVLRQIVRAHRLDPARISARWTARDRLITLIVEQVRARANLGRAFERV
jgi:hypothetical protein